MHGTNVLSSKKNTSKNIFKTPVNCSSIIPQHNYLPIPRFFMVLSMNICRYLN